jgi:hypothetical protein
MPRTSVFLLTQAVGIYLMTRLVRSDSAFALLEPRRVVLPIDCCKHGAIWLSCLNLIQLSVVCPLL